ncbi:MAG: hypothetical protein ACI843_001884 [Psychrobacter glaciei]|jgi:uncharacterized protein (DUF486 family)
MLYRFKNSSSTSHLRSIAYIRISNQENNSFVIIILISFVYLLSETFRLNTLWRFRPQSEIRLTITPWLSKAIDPTKVPVHINDCFMVYYLYKPTPLHYLHC